jgi:RND family efflux transporter MFP subunit
VLGTVVPSPKGRAVIQSPQTGKIVAIRTTVGQKVSAGQVLAIIEQQIEAGTQISLITQKNSVDAEYNAAMAQYERLKGIADIVAKKDLTEAKARFETAAKNKRLFEANAKGNMNSTKTITLTAPISGVVGTFNYSMGAVVSAGQTLFEITNLDKVFIEAQVFSNYAGKLNGIQKLTALSNIKDDTTEYNLKVVSTAQQVNPENQSQVVLFELINANGVFKIGENINVRIQSGESSRQIVIPEEAVSDVYGKPAVFIKDKAEQYSISYVNKGSLSNSIRPQILQQQVTVSQQELKAERAELLPQINTGPLFGLEDTHGQKRQGWRVSLSVPLWYNQNRARIKAAQTAVQLADAQRRRQVQDLNREYSILLAQLLREQKSLQYYTTIANLQANEISQTAIRLFQAGQMNYIETVRNIITAYQTKANYLETIRNFNQALIELKYLNGSL